MKWIEIYANIKVWEYILAGALIVAFFLVIFIWIIIENIKDKLKKH